MKFGNILMDSELINHQKVDYINYVNFTDKNNEIDKSLPTLVVGWKFLKVLNFDISQISILEKKIHNKLYWEFSFNENKSEHINGVEKFIESVPDMYFRSEYTYTDLNPLFFNISEFEELKCILPKEIKKSYMIENKMLYMLNNENKIIGIDLVSYNFFNFNVQDIISYVKTISKSFIDDKNSEIFIEKKQNIPNFHNLRRYMVTIL